jgi:hypothetical protein
MTRKRFVKLLMWLGYDRNGANLFATTVNGTYWFYSYQDTFERLIRNLAIEYGKDLA